MPLQKIHFVKDLLGDHTLNNQTSWKKLQLIAKIITVNTLNLLYLLLHITVKLIIILRESVIQNLEKKSELPVISKVCEKFEKHSKNIALGIIFVNNSNKNIK